MIKLKYDNEVDIANIKFNNNKVKISDELIQDFIFDFDENNKIVNIEILHASKHLDIKYF